MQNKVTQHTVPWLLVNAVLSNVLPHLLDLKHDQTRIRLAVSVVLGKEGNRLILAAVGHQVTGALGDEEDSDHDDDTGKALHDQGDLPRQIALDLVAAVGDGSSRDGATEPTAVIETDGTSTPVGRRDLDSIL